MKRERFSNIGYVMAAAGSAVGLGNIWKFPTLAGQNGGGVFILCYLVFVLVLGIPLLLGEATIGRHAQAGPTDAYRNIAIACGQGKTAIRFWTFLGFTGALANLFVLSFYSVIAGWILQYCFKVFTTPIGTMDMALFGGSISTPVTPTIFALIFVAVTVMIDVKGIEGGLEKAAKVLMPLLIILLIICAVCSLSLKGGIEGVKFMVVPNMEYVKAAGGLEAVALAAMGQCFFSLSLGVGQIITFGSYLKKDSNLLTETYAIPALDTGVALLAGLVTLPAVFAVSTITGIDPASQTGPGMLMYALPQSLNVAFGPAFGTILAFLMFLLVVFAALTSTCAMLTVSVSYINEFKKVDRKKATIGVGIAVAIGATICSLSNTDILGSILIGGRNIQDTLDWLVNTLIMPFGAFFMCIFIGYVWKTDNAIKEITNEGKLTFSWQKMFKILMTVVDPLIILIVFLSGIGIVKF